MRKYRVLTGFLALTVLPIPAVFAEGYSTDSPNQTTYTSQSTPVPVNMQPGYTVQAPPPVIASAPANEHKHRERDRDRHHDRDKLAVSINLADATAQLSQGRGIFIEKHGRRHHRPVDLEWVSIEQPGGFPRDMVTGGYQSNPPATLYVCRAPYRGGVLPGKLFRGSCNIAGGGNEIVASRYEVLTSPLALRWVPASYGAVPPHAVEGGFQHSSRLFICQARYRGGMHPGKLYKDACVIGWGGEEVRIPEYNVLTA